MKKIITVFLIYFLCIPIVKAKNEKEKEDFNTLLYKTLSVQNFVKSRETTSEGKRRGCSLDYAYSYRDWYSQNGNVVNVKGEFSYLYFQEKSVGFIFKIVPTVINPENEELIKMKPEYVDLFIKDKKFSDYKTTDFDCENYGRCIGYGDSNLELTSVLMETSLQDLETKFSLSKGGMDNNFKFFSLSKSPDSDRERLSFLKCMMELNKVVIQDMESQLNRRK